MDLVALCDTYMELKLAPIDAIWLFSVLMEFLPATLWLDPFHPPTSLQKCLWYWLH